MRKSLFTASLLSVMFVAATSVSFAGWNATSKAKGDFGSGWRGDNHPTAVHRVSNNTMNATRVVAQPVATSSYSSAYAPSNEVVANTQDRTSYSSAYAPSANAASESSNAQVISSAPVMNVVPVQTSSSSVTHSNVNHSLPRMIKTTYGNSH